MTYDWSLSNCLKLQRISKNVLITGFKVPMPPPQSHDPNLGHSATSSYLQLFALYHGHMTIIYDGFCQNKHLLPFSSKKCQANSGFTWPWLHSLNDHYVCFMIIKIIKLDVVTWWSAEWLARHTTVIPGSMVISQRVPALLTVTILLSLCNVSIRFLELVFVNVVNRGLLSFENTFFLIQSFPNLNCSLCWFFYWYILS